MLVNASLSRARAEVLASRQPASLHVLIAEDTALGCQLLGEALKRSRLDFGRIFCAFTHETMVQILKENRIDVAVLSDTFHSGQEKGIHILEQVHSIQSRARSILLVREVRPDIVLSAFQSGAKGVLPRTEPATVLFKCISAVHRGQIWINSEQLELILASFVRRRPIRIVSSNGKRLLTEREEEVASLIVDGLTNRQVADALGLRVHTVGNYLSTIYEKLGISTRVELVLYLLHQRQTQQAALSRNGPDAED
jgi:DNA-binding NarL/FixJ family response regulator